MRFLLAPAVRTDVDGCAEFDFVSGICRSAPLSIFCLGLEASSLQYGFRRSLVPVMDTNAQNTLRFPLLGPIFNLPMSLILQAEPSSKVGSLRGRSRQREFPNPARWRCSASASRGWA